MRYHEPVPLLSANITTTSVIVRLISKQRNTDTELLSQSAQLSLGSSLHSVQLGAILRHDLSSPMLRVICQPIYTHVQGAYQRARSHYQQCEV